MSLLEVYKASVSIPSVNVVALQVVVENGLLINLTVV